MKFLPRCVVIRRVWLGKCALQPRSPDEQGRISQDIAAMMVGLDRVEFLLEWARRGRDSFQVDFADLDRELARG